MLAALCLLVPVRAAAQAPAEEPTPAELQQRTLDAEDARDASAEGLAPILAALKSKDNETRRQAVRALGRLEQPSLAAAVSQVAFDPAPSVRAEAANAAAQIAAAGGDLGMISELLLGQLERESHPVARGAFALAAGRLPYTDVEAVRRAESAIAAALRAPADAGDAPRRSERDIPVERLQFAPAATLLGGLRGLEALTRRQAKIFTPDPATVKLLRELSVAWRSAVARAEGGPTAEAAARVRRLAMAALVSGRAADAATVSTAFGDPDEQVRRLAAQAAAASDPLDTKLVDRGIRDQSPMVRTALLLALARRSDPVTCGYASLGLADPHPHVAATAIDVAGRACAGNDRAVAAVAAVTRRLPPPPLPDVSAAEDTVARAAPPAFGPAFRGVRSATWQLAAHALVALAALAPEQATPRLEAFASDTRWQVRMYAARAAGRARARQVLLGLAGDEHDNVREAAVAGLREVVGHEADDVYLGALSRDDYQLLITAAKALEGTPRKAEAADALATAFERVTDKERETSRDTRRALLDRLEEVGTSALATRLDAYLKDFDPVIADRVAGLLGKWTGRATKPAPLRLPLLDRPTAADRDTMASTRLVFVVRDVGRFEVKLLPSEAPLNAWRFLRLARQGYFKGLTFHRVEPDFVLQCGSPGANEYMGDGPYTRDEVGLQSNTRGTIGLSTRGRDTGDGQFFVNLVDNVRLDHAFTVFAQIERGVEVIDAILEGDVIERVEIMRGER